MLSVEHTVSGKEQGKEGNTVDVVFDQCIALHKVIIIGKCKKKSLQRYLFHSLAMSNCCRLNTVQTLVLMQCVKLRSSALTTGTTFIFIILFCLPSAAKVFKVIVINIYKHELNDIQY